MSMLRMCMYVSCSCGVPCTSVLACMYVSFPSTLCVTNMCVLHGTVGVCYIEVRPLCAQHSILKPFMLRRVKKDVETEMTGKKEVLVDCQLSTRQQTLYKAIKNKISVADIFDGAGGQLNEKKVMHLMNIVIQLRKVPSNHVLPPMRLPDRHLALR